MLGASRSFRLGYWTHIDMTLLAFDICIFFFLFFLFDYIVLAGFQLTKGRTTKLSTLILIPREWTEIKNFFEHNISLGMRIMIQTTNWVLTMK